MSADSACSSTLCDRPSSYALDSVRYSKPSGIMASCRCSCGGQETGSGFSCPPYAKTRLHSIFNHGLVVVRAGLPRLSKLEQGESSLPAL